jgi:hypothetical protein
LMSAIFRLCRAKKWLRRWRLPLRRTKSPLYFTNQVVAKPLDPRMIWFRILKLPQCVRARALQMSCSICSATTWQVLKRCWARSLPMRSCYVRIFLLIWFWFFFFFFFFFCCWFEFCFIIISIIIIIFSNSSERSHELCRTLQRSVQLFHRR